MVVGGFMKAGDGSLYRVQNVARRGHESTGMISSAEPFQIA
jgi:hypothetical protein